MVNGYSTMYQPYAYLAVLTGKTVEGRTECPLWLKEYSTDNARAFKELTYLVTYLAKSNGNLPKDEGFAPRKTKRSCTSGSYSGSAIVSPTAQRSDAAKFLPMRFKKMFNSRRYEANNRLFDELIIMVWWIMGLESVGAAKKAGYWIDIARKEHENEL